MLLETQLSLSVSEDYHHKTVLQQQASHVIDHTLTTYRF